MRILIGHYADAGEEFDRKRYDVQFVARGRDGAAPATSLDEMVALCPPGWSPDVYYQPSLGHFPLPIDIETFAGLTVAGIQDADRLGRSIAAGAGFFDLLLTERNALRLLQAQELPNCHTARMWGIDPKIHRKIPGATRDIDILFLGSFNVSVWENRNRLLDRLAHLSGRFNVLIDSGWYGDDYTRLLNRARIVFNHSLPDRMNARALEAAACGALVFNEAENVEARELFTDRVHCVFYTDADLETLLEYYLTRDDERERVAEAGRRVASVMTAGRFLNEHFAQMEAQRAARFRPATRLRESERALAKALQRFTCNCLFPDPDASALLDEAERAGAAPERVLEARAATLGMQAQLYPAPRRAELMRRAIDCAERAVRGMPGSVVAQMTLGNLLLDRLAATGDLNLFQPVFTALRAAAECAEALRAAHTPGVVGDLEGFGYPRTFDRFEFLIGQSAMGQSRAVGAADPARRAGEIATLLAWRCRSSLSDLFVRIGRMGDAYRQAEAAAALLPRDPESLLLLATRAAAANRLPAAVEQYRALLDISPLSVNAWPEYARLLFLLGRRNEAHAFVDDRLHILRAFPKLREVEPLLRSALQP